MNPDCMNFFLAVCFEFVVVAELSRVAANLERGGYRDLLCRKFYGFTDFPYHGRPGAVVLHATFAVRMIQPLSISDPLRLVVV